MRVDLITAIPEIFGIPHNFPGFPEKNWELSKKFWTRLRRAGKNLDTNSFAQTLYKGVDTSPRNLPQELFLIDLELCQRHEWIRHSATKPSTNLSASFLWTELKMKLRILTKKSGKYIRSYNLRKTVKIHNQISLNYFFNVLLCSSEPFVCVH